MDAIQQTAVIDSTRRHLWLDEPLPETVSAGQVEITLVIADRPPRQADAPLSRRFAGTLRLSDETYNAWQNTLREGRDAWAPAT
jgi:hypothetical protein